MVQGLVVAAICAAVISVVVAVTVIFPRDKDSKPVADSQSHAH